MGKKDFRWKETKKTKKDAKKPASVEVIPPAVTVEVIKKGKKQEPGAEGEE